LRIAVLDDYQAIALKMADWSSLPSAVEVSVYSDHVSNDDTLIERLSDVEIIICMRERTPFPRSLLESLPNLKLLITTGMANASIDMDAAAALGIVVSGTSGSGDTTGELTWGLILALARSIPQEDKLIRLGQWQTSLGSGLRGKTLGLLGLGRIGSQVAGYGNVFGMSVIAWSENLTRERATENGADLVSKAALLKNSDVVSIHLRLSERTRGLLGQQDLDLMKPTAYLVNTSRGPIVDEDALIKTLRQRKLAGAALDVFDEEPLRPDHPLLSLDNTVLTPHLGYVTKESYAIMYTQALEDVLAFLTGEPIRVLNARD
jgi:phosphoglycerate dehydrogenase-like enzyme